MCYVFFSFYILHILYTNIFKIHQIFLRGHFKSHFYKECIFCKLHIYFFLCHGTFIYLIFTDTLSQFIFFNTKDKTNLLTFFRIYYDNLYDDGIEFIDNVMIAHSKISYMSLTGKLLIILSKSESVAT